MKVIDINNLPDDFYDSNGFPKIEYQFSLSDKKYSIGGICETHYGYGKIIKINKIASSVVMLTVGFDSGENRTLEDSLVKIIKGVVGKNDNTVLSVDHDMYFNTLDTIHKNNYNIVSDLLSREELHNQEKLEELEDYKFMSKNDQQDILVMGWDFPSINDGKLLELKNAKASLYFYFLIDIDQPTFISSHISDGQNFGDCKIIKYTSARAGYLKSNPSLGFRRTKLEVAYHEIISKALDLFEDKTLEVSKNNLTIQQKKEKNSTVGMGDISKVMKSEQDIIMRADPEYNTLISGVAGSGKTNLILHRIDYLLSEFSETYYQSSIGVFCYNVGLVKYISNMIHERFPQIQLFGKDKFMWDFAHRTMGKGYSYTNTQSINHEDIINQISDLIFEKIYITYSVTKKNKTKSERSMFDSGRQGSQTEYISISFDILRIAVDIGLIENTKQQLNYDQFLCFFYVISSIEIQEKNNLSPNLVIKNSDGDVIKKSSPLGYRSTTQDKEYSIAISKFKHIFIDEAQDMNKREIMSLCNLSTGGVTIAGDVSQMLFNGIGNKGEGDFKDLLGITIDNQYNLKTTFRGSLQTVIFANQYLDLTSVGIKAQKVGFTGSKPIVKVFSEIIEIGDILQQIIKQYHEKKICIVAGSTQQQGLELVGILKKNGINTYYAGSKTRDFEKKIHVTNYYQIKGLEFDIVVVVNTNKFMKSSTRNKAQILYTVATRAKDQLILLEDTLGYLDQFDKDTFELL